MEISKTTKRITVTAFTVLISVLIIFSYSSGRLIDLKSDDVDFDVLIFTQRWPATFCIDWTESSKKHTCNLPRAPEWTIHGVWPTQFGKLKPQFCNSSWPFQKEDLAPILPQLQSEWPNLEGHFPAESLWSHEWEKHGTCAAVLPELGSELKYFSKGLEWKNQYDLMSILTKAGISPESKQGFKALTIWEAVRSSTGKNPAIDCLRDKISSESYLNEIKICFDKSLKLTDCDGIVSYTRYRGPLLGNCPTHEMVYYPNSAQLRKTRSVKQQWLYDALRAIFWLQWVTR